MLRVITADTLMVACTVFSLLGKLVNISDITDFWTFRHNASVFFFYFTVALNFSLGGVVFNLGLHGFIEIM